LKRTTLSIAALCALTAGCSRNPQPATTPAPAPAGTAAPAAARTGAPALVPQPAMMEVKGGGGFQVTPKSVLRAASPAAQTSASALKELIRRGTGITLTPSLAADAAPDNAIEIVVDPLHASLGAEGYELTIDAQLVTLKAAAPAGAFYGVQTLRQMLPYWSEYEAILFRQPRTVALPPLHIHDVPRYEWRGAMLD